MLMVQVRLVYDQNHKRKDRPSIKKDGQIVIPGARLLEN